MLIEELLFKTPHGIVDQSLHARMGAEPTNGDGFGLGWYGSGEGPAVYRSIAPAWSDANLRELAAHTESPLFLPHVSCHRVARAGDELPPVPSRALAIRCTTATSPTFTWSGET